MRLMIPKEETLDETRVAATPESVVSLIKKGWEIFCEKGLGNSAHWTDRDYADAGATVCDQKKLFEKPGFILKVRAPSAKEAGLYPEQSKLLGMMHELDAQSTQLLRKKGIEHFLPD